MKLFFMFLLTGLSFSVSAGGTQLCKGVFSDEQLSVIKRSYQLGASQDVGMSLAAIAWKESAAGKYLMNYLDPSFGTYHILLQTAASRTKTDGWFNKIELAQDLMFNLELGAAMATEELLWWKAYFRRKKGAADWRDVWAAYNGGFNYDSTQAKAYSENIAEKIKWLGECVLTPPVRKQLVEALELGKVEPYKLALGEWKTK